MKKLTSYICLLAIYLLSLASVVNAQYQPQWWQARANVLVNPAEISVSVVNRSRAHLYCQGYVYGQTQYGKWLKQWAHMVLAPGQHLYVYMHANTYAESFIKGYANIKCHY